MNNVPVEYALDQMVLEKGAIKQAAAYLKEKGCQNVILTVDGNTYEAAGKELERELKAAGVGIRLCLIEPGPSGDVVADEPSLLQLLLEVNPETTDAVIAAGSGTIHDIVRFVCYKTGKPFVSVPTAPSVDGFTSKGAPLIVRGVKKTFPATGPVAIFADLDVLTKAPQQLVAAGFGDMLGKYTSLFDWNFSHLTAAEPYDQEVAAMTEKALNACVEHVDEIGNRTEEGIRILMTSLIESGIAMLKFGQSHPASGAEHHLSHFWEMEYLRRGSRALLHGAKVGVACAEISRLYHDAAFRGVYPRQEPDMLRKHGAQVREWLGAVPAEAEIRSLLQRAGGPSSLQELGIDDGLFAESLREAHLLRDRHTLLRALNEA
ncbi:sn-glycerol-1-phosphate dehydrogenase [Paenibacillus sp. VCA1]|uniref:sn-glycerol-1-phosphate dehydrogenase n=1 Tax=Paenibacillus sp. VCA1 TaxID=3039148 RepID=UPI0028727FE3|nr:sn-glycerol-1-phosphate dehydrogenase [Paenibacillus sp. VCA1]MDR9856556.1 sn-glycerol-1-phosphate dehydrogenase [Paenibacillus sp. VCA1]